MTDNSRTSCAQCSGIAVIEYPALHARTLCRRRFVGRIRLHLCPGCGHESWHPEDLRLFDRAIAWHLARARASAPDALRAMRNATGLGRADFAERLDLPESAVWRWESGEEAPSGALIASLCELVEAETSSASAFLLRIEPLPMLRLAASRADSSRARRRTDGAVVELPLHRGSGPTEAG